MAEIVRYGASDRALVIDRHEASNTVHFPACRVLHSILDHRLGGPHIYVDLIRRAQTTDIQELIATAGDEPMTQWGLGSAGDPANFGLGIVALLVVKDWGIPTDNARRIRNIDRVFSL